MRLLAILTLAVALAACSSSGPINEPAELKPLVSKLTVKRLWDEETPSSGYDEIYPSLSPLVIEGEVYTASGGGDLLAADATNGKRIWRRSLDTVVSGGVGGNNELIFVGTADAKVIALDRKSGDEKWRADVSTEVLTPPVATSSYVIVRCIDGHVYTLNSETGQLLWQLPRTVPDLTLRGEATPVVVGDTVLLGMADGHLLAVALYDGSVLWEAVVATPNGRTDLERMVDVDATPVVVDGEVYSAAYQGRVVALALDSGRLLWSRDIGSSIGLTVAGDRLYVVDDRSRVWALDRRNGSSYWMQDGLQYRKLTRPVVFGGGVVVGDFEGYLHWLSPEDGSLLARYSVDDEGIYSELKVAGDVAYVRSRSGRVEALQVHPRAEMAVDVGVE